ncbi:hypothetical protein G7A66_06850 [Altererythrobacter sp. SALINAS58]|uniref:hypothetical protein n=1 Tax=Alteripontixanthobacter muriae TaxID=2705546 RepID=UPI0015751C16|nr:hypothetical protein [Alteripontixanthobacter muriae]NTZ42810.1 hypothetical protein [Alteripontixanthobacter muriae]
MDQGRLMPALPRVLGLAAALVATLTLAACDESPEEAAEDVVDERGFFTVHPETGATMSAIPQDGLPDTVMVSGEELAGPLPLGFTLHEGAKVLDSTFVSRGEKQSALVIFESAAAPEELAEFYRGQAASAGIKTEVTLDGDAGRLVAGREGTARFSLNAAREGDVTAAQLMISDGLD